MGFRWIHHWTVQHLNAIVCEPLLDHSARVLCTIVVLEQEIRTQLQLLCRLLQVFLKNLAVVLLLHDALDPHNVPWTTCTECSPEHDGTTSVLDCGKNVLREVSLSRTAVDGLDVIVAEELHLCLIRPQNGLPEALVLVQMVLGVL